MNIFGYQKTTLLDYPGHVAAAVFTGSCNFACPFCHNRSLVLNIGKRIPEEEIFSFLNKRRHVLTGLCISGGEPTLQEDLAGFIRQARDLGFRIKLDTNGYRPEALEGLLKEGLLDYLAMDIKSGPAHYPLLTGLPAVDMGLIRRSIRLIADSGLPHEFRTTVVKDYHSREDFEGIARLLPPDSPYYLQAFQDRGTALTPGLKPCSQKEMEDYLRLVRPRLPRATLRGC